MRLYIQMLGHSESVEWRIYQRVTRTFVDQAG